MSTHYYLYTEVKINGIWYCINNKLKDEKNNKLELAVTYYSGSYSYFEDTYDKLRTIGSQVDKKDLSEELRNLYGTEIKQYEELPIAVKWEDIKKYVPSERLYEHHGYVHKDIIANFMLEEQEEIYEWLDIDEYRKLSPKEKKYYDYFEWDDGLGWFKYFKKIYEHVKWQIYEWQDVNYLGEMDDVRIVVFEF